VINEGVKKKVFSKRSITLPRPK
jgi:hypothetical protein